MENRDQSGVHSERKPGVRLDPATRKRVFVRTFQWAQTPEYRRHPRTLKELAKEEGVSYSHLKRVIKTIPRTKDEYLQECELMVLGDYPEILERLLDSAKGSSPAAAADRRLVITEIVKPLKQTYTSDRKQSEGEAFIQGAFEKLLKRRDENARLIEQKTLSLTDGKIIEGNSHEGMETLQPAER